eukprot:m.15999 g.15999  ORF g.15999 m.15999 type:complete len:778 (-) comp10827_c0_seq1:328-2661(-)
MTRRVCVLSAFLLFSVSPTIVASLNEIRWDNLESHHIDLPEDGILRFVWGDSSTLSNPNNEDENKQPTTAVVVELTPKPDELIAPQTPAGASDNTSLTSTDKNPTNETDVAIAASQVPSNKQDGAARRQRRQENTTASPSPMYNLVSGEVGESVYRFSSGEPTASGNVTISLSHLVNTSLTHIRFFCENHSDIEVIVQLPIDLERDPGYGQSKMALGQQNKLLTKGSITIYASVGGVAVLGLLLGVLLAYSRRRSSKNLSISGGTKKAASIDTDTLNKEFALEPVKGGRKPMLTKKKKSAVSVIDDIKQAWQKKENNSKSEPYRLLEILRSFREQQHAAMKEEEERRSQSAEVQKKLEATSTPDIAIESTVIEQPQQQQPAPAPAQAKARRGSRLDTKSKTTGATLGEVQITTTDSTESTSGKLWQNMTVPDIQKTVQRWKRESIDVDDAAALTVDPSSDLKESAENITAEFSFQPSEQDKAAWLAVQDAWQEATSSCESDENEEMRTHPASEVFDFDEDTIDVKASTTTITQPLTKKAGPVAALQKRTHQSRLDAWSLSTGEADSSSSGIDSANNSSDNDNTESGAKTIKSPLRRKSREHKSPVKMRTDRVATRMSIPQESVSSRLSWSLSGGGDTDAVEPVVSEPKRMRKFSEDVTTPLPFMIARARVSHDRASYDNSALGFKKNDLIQVFKKQPKGVWEGAVIKSGKPTARGSFPFTMVDIVPASKYSAEIKALEKQYTPQSVLATDTVLPMRVNPLFSSDSPQQVVVDDGADE